MVSFPSRSKSSASFLPSDGNPSNVQLAEPQSLTMVLCRGREGESELEDYNYNMTKARRRTNSSTQAAGHSVLKTKFEAIDPEVIEYEEDIHGPRPSDVAEQQDLEDLSTSSSADTNHSVEEEDAAEKK